MIKDSVKIIVLSGAVMAFCGGCGYSAQQRAHLIESARENGVIVYFNGFLSDETRRMTEGLADELDMAHLPDRRDVLDILRAGENSRYGNNLVNHSAGAGGAKAFAEWGSRNNIEFRTVSSLDAFTADEFPNNVIDVINYHSSYPHIFGKGISRGGRRCFPKETIYPSNHLNLPWKAKPFIRREIMGAAYRKIPMGSGR